MFIVAIHYCIKGLFTLRARSPVLKLIRHLIVKGKVSENRNKAPVKFDRECFTDKIRFEIFSNREQNTFFFHLKTCRNLSFQQRN